MQVLVTKVKKLAVNQFSGIHEVLNSYKKKSDESLKACYENVNILKYNTTGLTENYKSIQYNQPLKYSLCTFEEHVCLLT